MQGALADHAAPAASFVAMLVVAGLVAGVAPPAAVMEAGFSPIAAEAIALPAPANDRDLDGFQDADDLTDGDLVVVMDILGFEAPVATDPYFLVATDDDHWRTGRDAALAWRHIVDPDPLGLPVGSPEWQAYALRTGVTLQAPARPRDDSLGGASALEVVQRSIVNVRDDRATVRWSLSLWDAGEKPDAALGAWELSFDVVQRTWRVGGDARDHAEGEVVERGGVRLAVRGAVEPSQDVKRNVAERWTPVVLFDSGERFFPTRGETLAKYHGFAKRNADHRTWTSSFNNGRDAYRLFVADFNGDARVDHRDTVLLVDILRSGGEAPDHVYAHVALAGNDRLVVQYWFLSMWNFVADEAGRDVGVLTHRGDREFVQLVFANVTAALEGRPMTVAYSQHYGGITFPDPGPGAPPFHLDAEHPAVYPARGSHASYPVPGDDRAVRNQFAGFGDVFDGAGERWVPGEYGLEVLAAQTWHAGHLWGPLTRHSRDLGTATRPLLQHGFTYPFQDPLAWQEGLVRVAPEDLAGLYGFDGAIDRRGGDGEAS